MKSDHDYITTAELRRVSSLLIDHLEDLGVQVIRPNVDYYWCLKPAEKYELLSDPETLLAGQLSHDIERLKQMLKDPDMVVREGFAWLANLLAYIGEMAGG